MSEAVVLIHGLWMNGIEMSLLRRRLSGELGCETHRFSYSSITGGLARNAQRLRRFIDRLAADRVHLVGHSLGGVLALQMLHRWPTDRVARVVCLGSPLTGSAPATFLSRSGAGRFVVGRTLRDGVLDRPLRILDIPQQVGVIAGTAAISLGTVLGVLEKPHDGVVTVRETQLEGLTDHIELPVNHIGLVLSAEVARQTAAFLRDGRFAH